MRLVRFEHDIAESALKRISWGEYIEDHIRELYWDNDDTWKATGAEYSFDQVSIMAPAIPGKIICVGLNYRDHAAELGMPPPDEPVVFLKPGTSLLASEEKIVRPSSCKELDYEAEIAVVVSRKCRRIQSDHVKEHLWGYTCFNDVTARDLQRKDGQWTRAKSFDTFAPLGPYIETDHTENTLDISLKLNGEEKQSSDSSNMIYSIEETVSYISNIMTLNPGDIIATGTPSGVGSMQPGDRVEVMVGSLGVLRNYITEEN
ncbi:fumarylacetoacetate hydrolase family protein [Elusimicrobiota bacterium]